MACIDGLLAVPAVYMNEQHTLEEFNPDVEVALSST
jgi:hypothetical protein